MQQDCIPIEARGDFERLVSKEQPQPPSDAQELIQRAKHGDLSVLAELRAWLVEHPEVWKDAGELTQQAERSWIGAMTGSNLVHRESVSLALEDLKAGLASEGSSPLEQLLIDQIGLAWIESSYFSTYSAQTSTKPMNASRREEIAKRQDRAHRRLMKGIKTLATIRRLLQKAPMVLQPVQDSSEEQNRVEHRFRELLGIN